VRSRDVTSAVGIINIQFWRTFTLLSLCLRHVIWRGDLVGSHASTPLKFLLAHTFREKWRTSRLTRAPRQIMWRKQSDICVSVRQNSMLNIPTALVTSRELTCREDSVPPGLIVSLSLSLSLRNSANASNKTWLAPDRNNSKLKTWYLESLFVIGSVWYG
jgi:hypothetical protein